MLTEHFGFEELIDSAAAKYYKIDNEPTDSQVLVNLQKLAEGLERVRAAVQSPLVVNSGYRSPELNTHLRGWLYSEHMLGLAADIQAVDFPPRELMRRMVEAAEQIGFRQCILERNTWVHVSFPAEGVEPKLEVLTASWESGKIVYRPGFI